MRWYLFIVGLCYNLTFQWFKNLLGTYGLLIKIQWLFMVPYYVFDTEAQNADEL